MARARQAVAAQLVLHARLVAEQLGGLGVRARHAERARGPRRAGPAAARGCRATRWIVPWRRSQHAARPRSAGRCRARRSTVTRSTNSPASSPRGGSCTMPSEPHVGERRPRRARSASSCRGGTGRRTRRCASRRVVHDGRHADEGRVPGAELSARDAAVHARPRRGRRRGLRRRRHAGPRRCPPRSSSTSTTTSRSRASSTRTTWSSASPRGCAAARSIACSRTGRSWC